MTKIPWTDTSWNPVVGCAKVSTGCQNCYAEKMAARLAHMGHEKYFKVVHYDGYNGYVWNNETYLDDEALDKPLHWKHPRMVFVDSMGDLFHESVPFEFIAEVVKVVAFTEQHTYQFLTKRIKRALEFFKWLENRYTYDGYKLIFKGEGGLGWQYKPWPLPNLWLGVTAENQETADKRIPMLLRIPAAVRFVSIEPCLGEIKLKWNIVYPSERWSSFIRNEPPRKGIDWVIIGAESKGSGAGRECKIEWVQSIVSQCKAADVPVFVKQLHIVTAAGTSGISTDTKEHAKAKSWVKIKLIKDITQFPKDLQIQEYPKVKK